MVKLRGRRVRFLKMPCSFGEHLAKRCVGAPPPPKSWRPYIGKILDLALYDSRPQSVRQILDLVGEL